MSAVSKSLLYLFVFVFISSALAFTVVVSAFDTYYDDIDYNGLY